MQRRRLFHQQVLVGREDRPSPWGSGKIGGRGDGDGLDFWEGCDRVHRVHSMGNIVALAATALALSNSGLKTAMTSVTVMGLEAGNMNLLAETRTDNRYPNWSFCHNSLPQRTFFSRYLA